MSRGMNTLLVVNAGSSSLKFCVYSIDEASAPALVARGQIDGIGTRPRLRARDAGGATLADQTFAAGEVADVAAALDRVGVWLRQKYARSNLVAVGHRVAHGGPRYSAPVIVDATVLTALERFVPLAPLHQPHHLRPMRTLAERYPGVVQVACFDTAFHRGHPEVADRYALPDDLYKEGVRRYGFHGLSYEYIARRLPAVAPDIARGAGDERHRRGGVHGRHRRELAGDSCARLRALELAGAGRRRGCQSGWRAAHLVAARARVRLGDPDRRGGDDRRAHPRGLARARRKEVPCTRRSA